MSFYSSAIRCHQIDPSLDQSNFRAEFKFDPSTVYLSNLRLCNVGILADIGNWNVGSGCLDCIKTIQLLDGAGQVLDQLRFTDKYSHFKNYGKSNEMNKSLYRHLVGSNMGYEVKGYQVSGASPSGPLETVIGTPQTPPTYEQDPEDTFPGYIDLRMLLPMLNSVLYLPTQVFKNLTLRIEFKSAVGSNQNTLTPLLIADSLANLEMASKVAQNFQGATYVSVEHDSVVIDALSPTSTNQNPVQAVKKLMRGFDNKHLNRLVLMKEPASNSTEVPTELGSNTSQLYFRERENLRVNGRNLLVEDMNTPNKALAKLTDVYGSHNSYINQNALNQTGLAIATLATQLSNMLGGQDFRAFLVDEYVEDMEVSFGRTGVYKNTETDEANKLHKLNNQLTIHAFGEVKKTLQVNKDGSYLIAYPRN